MKLNFPSYKSWDIDESKYPYLGTFEEQMKFILGFAVLAPSTFNSQPWKCKIVNSEIEVYLDKNRITKQSDKSGRFAHISIGSFLENLRVAASYYDWSIKIEFNLKLVANKPLAIVKLTKVNQNSSQKEKDLFKAIKVRTTNRSINLKKISEEIIEKTTKFIDNNQSIIYCRQEDRGKLISISIKGDKETWSNFEFRKEHVQWVRHNLTRAYDGMPGFGVGIGLIPSFFAYPIILSPLFPKIQAKKNIKSLNGTLYFATLCCEDNKIEWIKIGMLYERIFLSLTSHGIAVAPMGHFIESDLAREELQNLIKDKTPLLPQMFFRFGYPSNKIHHSPRLPVEKIIF